MAQNVEIFMLPVEETSPLELSSSSEKDPEKIKRAEISEKISVAGDELQDDTAPKYTDEQYKKLKRKADRYLLPLMWLCYGIQQTDKTSIGTQATFGLGLFECCISPGFILVVGSWYTTREHSSRSLVFQSANAGFGIIANLILYGIGSLQYSRGPEFQAWRYMSYFLGGMTILTGFLCLFLLGTPSEVRWLSPEERKIANARIMTNNTGHDRTGIKRWKWNQARECLIDPCTIPPIAVLVILLDIPRNLTSVIWFVIIGVATSRKKNLRMYFMIFSVIPPVAGFIMMATLPNEPHYKWIKWAGYFVTVTSVVALFLAWTLIPSNVAGRTKRTLTSSFTFVGYCVGNMVGSQIFLAKDAPRYIPGTAGCAVCFGLEFIVLIAWRIVLVMRNWRREKWLRDQGITEEERVERGKRLGEQDCTDFENPYTGS
ncbi:hypothetical protein Daesc_007767 [Daldinia eschscholtzii]|uniref:Transporter n=1 Tax=Daldinia eschscholtzii TaxID=292717 RepID=A0AAX6MFK7_9PEZI